MNRWVLVLLIVLLGCASPEPPEMLPAPTQDGRGTFGMQKDGVNWVPTTTRKFVYNLGAMTVLYAAGTLIVEARRSLGRGYEQLSFQLNVQQPGSFSATDASPTFVNTRTDISYNQEVTGWVEVIRLDSTEGIVSGTFLFRLENLEGQSVSLTEGRFDLLLNEEY